MVSYSLTVKALTVEALRPSLSVLDSLTTTPHDTQFDLCVNPEQKANENSRFAHRSKSWVRTLSSDTSIELTNS